jgi:hypothetical protein
VVSEYYWISQNTYFCQGEWFNHFWLLDVNDLDVEIDELLEIMMIVIIMFVCTQYASLDLLKHLISSTAVHGLVVYKPPEFPTLPLPFFLTQSSYWKEVKNIHSARPWSLKS